MGRDTGRRGDTVTTTSAASSFFPAKPCQPERGGAWRLREGDPRGPGPRTQGLELAGKVGPDPGLDRHTRASQTSSTPSRELPSMQIPPRDHAPRTPQDLGLSDRKRPPGHAALQRHCVALTALSTAARRWKSCHPVVCCITASLHQEFGAWECGASTPWSHSSPFFVHLLSCVYVANHFLFCNGSMAFLLFPRKAQSFWERGGGQGSNRMAVHHRRMGIIPPPLEPAPPSPSRPK